MRSRTERKKEFDSIKQNLFDAGASVLTVANATEDLFTSSVKALTAALDAPEAEPPAIAGSQKSIRQLLHDQQRKARQIGDVDGYLAATQKLQLLDQFELDKLERKARRLEAEIRIRQAQEQLAQLKATAAPSELDGEMDAISVEAIDPSGEWTASSLKAQFKTLLATRKALGINAKSWQEAVEQANRLATDELVRERGA